jgi:hypothetical protein
MSAESRTHKYDHPSENRGLLVFGITQPSSLDSFCRLDNEETSVIVTAGYVVVETLGPLDELDDEKRRRSTNACKVFDGILWHCMRLELREQKATDSRIQDLELVSRGGAFHDGG